MKNLIALRSLSLAAALSLLSALSACGGGGEERMISVYQPLPTDRGVGAIPGSAQYSLAPFRRAGGVAINPRCGALYDGLISNFATTSLVFEVRESQLPLAIAASFGEFGELSEIDKADRASRISRGFPIVNSNGVFFSGEPYDCVSRGL